MHAFAVEPVGWAVLPSANVEAPATPVIIKKMAAVAASRGETLTGAAKRVGGNPDQRRAMRPPAYELMSITNARPTKNHSNPVTWCPEPQSQKAA